MFARVTQAFSGLLDRLTSQRRIAQAEIERILAVFAQDLVQADVPYEVAQAFIKRAQQKIEQDPCPSHLKPQEHIAQIIHTLLAQHLQVKTGPHPLVAGTYGFPLRIMLVGLQGAGKTTTAAKIAYALVQQAGRPLTVMLTSLDTVRPAADEQLAVLAQKQGYQHFKRQGADACAIAKEVMAIPAQQAPQVMVIDTAGRMATNAPDLQELQSVVQIIKPHHVLLVLDGMTGQQALEVARTFSGYVSIDGMVLTKMDSDARGGAAFACTHVIAAPIVWVGTGERIQDLLLFRPDRIARRMMGLGDLDTLLEEAERKSRHAQLNLEQRLISGQFTYNDFAQQLKLMQSLGSMQSLLSFLPQVATKNLADKDMSNAERFLAKARALIDSMTPQERAYPDLLKVRSRQERIAQGAGLPRTDLVALMEKFEQLRSFVKLMYMQGKRRPSR
jgi:signal recognition particle subunit SRP54